MRFAIPMIGLLCCLADAQTQDRTDPIAIFEWLQNHGYPELSDKEFVRLKIGDRVEHGFLIRAGASTATVFTIDGLELELDRSDRTSWTDAAFEEHVRSLQRLAADDPSQFNLRHPQVPTPGYVTTFLVLAWAAEQRGMRQLATELIATATRLNQDRTKTLVRQLAEDLVRTALWQLCLDFADPSLSWSELAARSDRIARRYPEVRATANADRMHSILLRMLQEQAAHEAAAAGQGSHLDDLVFRLREQNGSQVGPGGSFDVFADPRGNDSPAAQLLAAGDAAIPHLLASLDSDGMTRCVMYLQPTFFSHRVMPHGEVARRVFARITGYLPRDRADGARWWQDFEQRGAVAVYADGAARGDAEMARRLLVCDSEVALAVIGEALTTVAPDRLAAMIRVAGGIPDSQVADLLRTHLRESTAGDARLAAAAALCMRGEIDAAITGVIDAWRSTDPRLSRPELGRFLVGSGRRNALQAVFELPDRLDDVMLTLLTSGATWPVSVLRPDGSGETAEWTRAEVEPGLDEDLERLLGERVEDGKFNVQIRAARVLARRWPALYAFDSIAKVDAQRLQLREIRTTWRRRQGLPELPQQQRR
ncbi:MAG: hypothetical protein KDC98_12325 [Planctomycetes bacterium]|nr:hypothetical protein [Planctomycetota bacterium]